MTIGRIPSVEGGIQPTLLTTAGDIIYASSASNPARLGIGTAGQVLKVNSGASAPEWGSASGTDPFLTPEVAGYYIKRAQSGIATGSHILTEDRTYYLPVFLPTASYDRISIRTGDYAGTATVRLGLYNASATTGLPTTVVFDAGTVSPTAIDTNYEITISQSLSAGYYYMAFNLQAFTGDGNYFAGGVMTTPPLPFLLTATSFGLGLGITHFTENSITGAFATAGTLNAQTGSTCPIIGMRIA